MLKWLKMKKLRMMAATQLLKKMRRSIRKTRRTRIAKKMRKARTSMRSGGRKRMSGENCEKVVEEKSIT